MNVIPLTPNVNVAGFDCGDSDLNDFLLDDALHFFEKRIANTFILEDEGKIVAYFLFAERQGKSFGNHQ